MTGGQSGGAAPLPTLTVWSGEWPYVKQGVVEVREGLTWVYVSVRDACNLQAYTAQARSYGRRADSYVTAQTARAAGQLRRHRWLLPATGISLLSLFVAIRSAPWGRAAMLRNGLLTAPLLTFLLYPREVFGRVDAWLPFSTTSLERIAEQDLPRVQGTAAVAAAVTETKSRE